MTYRPGTKTRLGGPSSKPKQRHRRNTPRARRIVREVQGDLVHLLHIWDDLDTVEKREAFVAALQVKMEDIHDDCVSATPVRKGAPRNRRGPVTVALIKTVRRLAIGQPRERYDDLADKSHICRTLFTDVMTGKYLYDLNADDTALARRAPEPPRKSER